MYFSSFELITPRNKISNAWRKKVKKTFRSSCLEKLRWRNVFASRASKFSSRSAANAKWNYAKTERAKIDYIPVEITAGETDEARSAQRLVVKHFITFPKKARDTEKPITDTADYEINGGVVQSISRWRMEFLKRSKHAEYFTDEIPGRWIRVRNQLTSSTLSNQQFENRTIFPSFHAANPYFFFFFYLGRK